MIDAVARGLAASVRAKQPRLALAAKIQRLAAQAAVSNPIDLAANAALATMTVQAGASPTAGLTKKYSYASTPTLFSVYGGAPTVVATFYQKLASVSVVSGGVVNTTKNQYAGRMAFMTDAPSVDIYMVASGTTQFRVMVNGQYLTKAGTSYNTSGGSSITNLTFGSSTTRRIDIEWMLDGGIQGGRAADATVGVGPTYSIWAPDTSDSYRIGFFGDSITTGTGATLNMDGYAVQAAKLLGGVNVDPWQIAIGGTGFVTTGGQYTFIQHISDIATASPDALVVSGGRNDVGQGGVQAAVTTFLTSARGLLPNAPIVVLGVWPGNSGPDAATIATEASIQAAVLATGDANIYFVPVSTASPAAWITGTGKVGTTTGVGNSDLYTSSDGTHPSDAGHAYIARRVAAAIRSAILTWSAL